jgi:hypothetical protein
MPARPRVELPFSGPTADRTLDSRLSFWTAWRLRAGCGHADCPKSRLVPVQELLSARGDMTVRDMAGRLRCSLCGEPAASLAFLRGSGEDRIVHPVRRAGRRPRHDAGAKPANHPAAREGITARPGALARA